MKKRQLFFRLFISTFYLSAFTLGGGYVIVPLMRKRFVEQYGWVEEQEMLDLIALAQSAPGPIAVNTSILIGYRMAGFWGALITVLGTVMPPFIIISIISVAYTAFRDSLVVSLVLKGMQAGVAAVVIDVVINMVSDILKTKKVFSILVMVGAFGAAYFLEVNVIYIILICGFIGAMGVFFKYLKRSKESL